MTSCMARRRRGSLVAALLAAPALSGCLHGEDASREPVAREPAAVESGAVTIARGRAGNVAYVTGDRAYGLVADRRGAARLRTAVASTLVSTLSPAAALDPTRRQLAYNAWLEGGPSIRLHSPATGEDRVLEAGAFSLAWRADGGIAYVKLTRARINPRRERPRGHVVVRGNVGSRPIRWSEHPRHYVVAAWARDRLLAYRVPRVEGRWPDLLALDGPGRARVLARRSGLVALSPDGRRALLTRYGASPPVVSVVDVERGVEEARLRLHDEPPAGRVQWVTESGTWTGRFVVAKASPGLIVFRMGASEISVDQVLRFDRAAYPLGVFEPKSDATGTRITMWAQRAQQPRAPVPRATLISCDRVQRRCVEDPSVAASGELRLIAEPSRR
jgi:hypothetical protein